MYGTNRALCLVLMLPARTPGAEGLEAHVSIFDRPSHAVVGVGQASYPDKPVLAAMVRPDRAFGDPKNCAGPTVRENLRTNSRQHNDGR